MWNVKTRPSMSMSTEIATAAGDRWFPPASVGILRTIGFLTYYAMRAFGEAPALNVLKARLVGLFIRQNWALNASLRQGSCKRGYQRFGLEELSRRHAPGCSENASMVPDATTPKRMTASGPTVFLFINPYKSKRSTSGILEKFNPASACSSIRHASCYGHQLCELSERFIVSKHSLEQS